MEQARVVAEKCKFRHVLVHVLQMPVFVHGRFPIGIKDVSCNSINLRICSSECKFTSGKEDPFDLSKEEV
jgi:hypothetical protein